MCFYIDEKHPTKKTAKRDIPCYKALFKINGNLEPPYQDYVYNLNELANSDIVLDLECIRIINDGLHSYSTKNKAIRWWDKYLIYKAIIPKGSIYYYNSESKEYVSNQLIVIEKLDD